MGLEIITKNHLVGQKFHKMTTCSNQVFIELNNTKYDAVRKQFKICQV